MKHLFKEHATICPDTFRPLLYGITDSFEIVYGYLSKDGDIEEPKVLLTDLHVERMCDHYMKSGSSETEAYEAVCRFAKIVDKLRKNNTVHVVYDTIVDIDGAQVELKTRRAASLKNEFFDTFNENVIYLHSVDVIPVKDEFFMTQYGIVIRYHVI